MRLFAGMKHLGLKIVQLRAQKGFDQAELAKAIGIKQPSLSKLESGKSFPKKKTLVKLAQVFQVPVDFFFDDAQANIERTAKSDRLPSGGESQKFFSISEEEKVLVTNIRLIKARNFTKNLTAFLILNPQLLIDAVSAFEEYQPPTGLALQPASSHPKKLPGSNSR